LAPFGTTPSTGGSTLLIANGCGEVTGFWSSWEQGCARTLDESKGGGAFFGSSGADFGAIQLEEACHRLVVARSNYWSGLVPEFFAGAFLISYKL
jgi:hypothetical protein